MDAANDPWYGSPTTRKAKRKKKRGVGTDVYKKKFDRATGRSWVEYQYTILGTRTIH